MHFILLKNVFSTQKDKKREWQINKMTMAHTTIKSIKSDAPI